MILFSSTVFHCFAAFFSHSPEGDGGRCEVVMSSSIHVLNFDPKHEHNVTDSMLTGLVFF